MTALTEDQLRDRRSFLVAKQAREGLPVDEAFELGRLNFRLGGGLQVPPFRGKPIADKLTVMTGFSKVA